MSIDLLADPIHAAATAIVQQFQLQSWPADVVFRYVTVPELDARDLGKETHVLIGGESTDSERLTRGHTKDLVKVAFAVRARCKPHEVERFTRLQSIAYTVGRSILTMDPNTICASAQIIRTNLSHDVERLRAGEFITIRTAELITKRGLAQ